LKGVLDWSVGRAMGRHLGTSMAQKNIFARGDGDGELFADGKFPVAIFRCSPDW
jgi:hypothetical protein